jgi:hypothetical protein
MMHAVLNSEWGRLFQHWGAVKADDRGYPAIPEGGVELQRTGLRALGKSVGILATCVREAPEFGRKKRHRQAAASSN